MKTEDKYLRMSANERVQHFLLLSSFIVLVITGFALKFPESFWVKGIAAVIGQNTFEARGIVHRIASVVLVLVSLYHVYYLFFTVRGKQLFKDFLPNRQDVTDFMNSMKYLIGKSDTKPLFGRFSYIEKMEYWAVVWGTFIMGITGVILWFENFFLKYVTNTGMDISSAIHYYEAILASLAIVVWHFYFIFLNPDVYPMNKAWLKGYLTREQMEHEHPLELEASEKQDTDKIKENLSEKAKDEIETKNIAVSETDPDTNKQ